MPKTLSQKFFIKPDFHLLILDAPENFLQTQLTDLPNGVSLVSEITDSPEIILQFTTSSTHLLAALPNLLPDLLATSYLWICYPKGGTKAAIATDLNRDILWKMMVERGLKAVHQISIDEIWSAVRFRIV